MGGDASSPDNPMAVSSSYSLPPVKQPWRPAWVPGVANPLVSPWYRGMGGTCGREHEAGEQRETARDRRFPRIQRGAVVRMAVAAIPSSILGFGAVAPNQLQEPESQSCVVAL